MKKLNNINIMRGLKNDLVISFPEFLDRLLDELETTNKRLTKLENKKPLK